MKQLFVALLLLAAKPSLCQTMKINIQHEIIMGKAKAGNKQPVYISMCLTDPQGILYNRFGPEEYTFFDYWLPDRTYNDHIKPMELTGIPDRGGVYNLRIEPGPKDVWHRGEHLFRIELKNATAAGAIIVKVKF